MAQALTVADYIIMQTNHWQQPVSHLHLQKIMYFLNVIHLLQEHQPLITNAQFEKWDYGPVLSVVFQEYSDNGTLKIQQVPEHVFLVEAHHTFTVKKHLFQVADLSPEDQTFIDQNLKKFIDRDPFALVRQSYQEPQWQNRDQLYYDNQKTIAYYSQPEHQFWLQPGKEEIYGTKNH